MDNIFENPLDELEITNVRAFSKWQVFWAWVFMIMTGQKIGLTYKKEKDEAVKTI